MGNKWKGAAGQCFSEGWPLSLRNCSISSKCVLFCSFLFINATSSVQRPQPTNAYFGQKDIQQALLLRRLVGDLHLSHPTPDHLHIVPTARDATNGLALSSRNVYLTPAERQLAPAFYGALQDAARAWAGSASKRETVQCALTRLEAAREEGEKGGVEIRVDYVEMNDPDTFGVLGDEQVQRSDCAPVILSGAVWFGRTRLIDNMILGKSLEGIVAN
jgi:pantoate--beta-alanine ligase